MYARMNPGVGGILLYKSGRKLILSRAITIYVCKSLEKMVVKCRPLSRLIFLSNIIHNVTSNKFLLHRYTYSHARFAVVLGQF